MGRVVTKEWTKAKSADIGFLDAIASSSSWCCQSVSESVIISDLPYISNC